MQTQKEIDLKFLGTITSDFVGVADILREASYQIRSRKISLYPIFPICMDITPTFALIIEAQKSGTRWNYYASFLGEFLDRNLIDAQTQDNFIAAYKDPEEFCCLFIITPDFVHYVFVPYPED